MNQRYKTIAAHIRSAIKESDMSRFAIAKLAGVDPSGLYRFLAGQKESLRIDTADRLLKLLGLEIRKKESK